MILEVGSRGRVSNLEVEVSKGAVNDFKRGGRRSTDNDNR